MKKLLCALLAALCIIGCLSLSACKSEEDNNNREKELNKEEAADYDSVPDEMTSEEEVYEIVFITYDLENYASDLENNASRQIYDGVKYYASQNGKSYKYCIIEEDTVMMNALPDALIAGYVSSVCASGAKTVVLYVGGEDYSDCLGTAPVNYPDVKFICIETSPRASESSASYAENVSSVHFDCSDSAFLAGYAAVSEGITKLGYVYSSGDESEKSGFIRGANTAAAKKDIIVSINTATVDENTVVEEFSAKLNGWYTTGTKAVFAEGSSAEGLVLSSAEANNAYIITEDGASVEKPEFTLVKITKNYASVTRAFLAKAYSSGWSEVGGKANVWGVDESAVGLDTSPWNLKEFTLSDYEKLQRAIIKGEITTEIGDEELKNVIINEN